ncbi:Stromalin conservative domain [Phytophthora cactorum]|nr:Stromalin conservative domain [Phytophthora cactorum]
MDVEAEEQDALVTNEQGEASSDGGREGEDEEFTPAGTKVKKPKSASKAARTPTARARSSRRKRSPWSQTRSLQSIGEGRKSKKNGATAEMDEAAEAGNDHEQEDDGYSLFSLWRDGSCVPESEPLAQLDMGDLVDHVVDDLEKANGEYPLMSRRKGMRKFQCNFEEFWEVFVKECNESEILFTSEIANNFIDWLTTLSRALYENRLQQVLKLVNLVFTGVVVHRYRDIMPEIRMVTMQCLGHWITTLPDHFLKDSFLKYLGWLLSDKSASVRLEVVQILCELYENDAFTEKLELFTARFLPRYLELCSDVDDGVVEEAIHLLIAVEKHNLISSDMELQPVEKLVFDAEHEDIRKAAAEFVCLQYDAFGVAVSKTKNATLKKEQLNTQAIALVEFAEEYIQNYGVPEDAVETLVDAFWGLEDCLVLQDWRLITDLLLVDKSAPDLSSEQQTILLRLLVASVRKLVGDGANRSHGLTIIYFDLLWTTAPIFKTIEEFKKLDSSSNATSESTEAEVDPSIQGQIQKVCQSRSVLEEALISVLEMHLARVEEATDEEHKESEETRGLHSVDTMEVIEFEDEDVISYVREAQRFAFLTLCDARCLFVEKFQDATAPYDALAWTLPNVLVHLPQMHFESEMDDAEEDEPQSDDDALREWQEKQQRKAELLVALGRVALCNSSKRYQAVSVLQYFTSSGKSSVEVVKAFGKQVKTDAPARRAEREGGKQGAELKELAKRFSQSLGVGKVPSSLRAPFLRFLREGVRYALEQPTQFEFLETMRVYLSRLDNSNMAQLREYFMERLKTLHDVPGDSEDLDSRWRALFDFQASITSTGVANGRKRISNGVMLSPPLKSKRRSASSEPTPMQGTSIAEEDEDENAERKDRGVRKRKALLAIKLKRARMETARRSIIIIDTGHQYTNALVWLTKIPKIPTWQTPCLLESECDVHVMLMRQNRVMTRCRSRTTMIVSSRMNQRARMMNHREVIMQCS